MASARKRSREPQRDDFVGEREGDNASADREHVRVIVLAREPRRVQIVAERRADAGDLVGGDLLALSAAADDDPAVRPPLGDLTRHREADGRIVDRRLAVGTVIVNGVAQALERLPEVLLQRKPRMVGADGDAHGHRLYYVTLA